MPTDRRNMPEQELSIKEREQQLFVESSEDQRPNRPVRPFAEYLRETPAAPIPVEVKALLWIVGVVVAILFAAAIWKASRSSVGARRARGPAPPAAEDSDGGFLRVRPKPGWLAASQTKKRTAPASVARRHRGSSSPGGGSIPPVLQVPNSGRRDESWDWSRWMIDECICETRDSLRSSVAPISFIVSSS